MSYQRMLQIVAWMVAAAVMSGVFAMYIQPDFLVVLSNQVWACF